MKDMKQDEEVDIKDTLENLVRIVFQLIMWQKEAKQNNDDLLEIQIKSQ